ncbi:unnamed protein product [Effrenium voratum]|uniref:Uncharacterized protein n=1 Tax=Effrenium voratum TaxID=2562239 RepID=A0AA36JCC6_9DINO|nr:unnamed protein product [Effrenium voratum]
MWAFHTSECQSHSATCRALLVALCSHVPGASRQCVLGAPQARNLSFKLQLPVSGACRMTGHELRPKSNTALHVGSALYLAHFPMSSQSPCSARGVNWLLRWNLKTGRGVVCSVTPVARVLLPYCQSAAFGDTRMALNAFLPVLLFLALDMFPHAQKQPHDVDQCQKLLSSKIMLHASCSLLSDSSTGRLPRLSCQEACSLVSFVGPLRSCLDVGQSSLRRFRIRPGHEVLLLKRASWDLGVGYLAPSRSMLRISVTDPGMLLCLLAPQLSIAVA